MRKAPNDYQHDNPFDLTKASDYSDRQVMEYWVDVGNDKRSLIDFLKPTSLVPMFLLGGKGSGKTHLMRYCSSTVQGLRYTNLRAAISEEKYLGIYTSADGLNVYRFSGKGQSEEVWETVFAYSFELWLIGCLLTSLRPALVENELSHPEWNRTFVQKVLELMHVEPTVQINDYDGIVAYLGTLRSAVDRAVNNTAITRQLSGIEVTFNPGDLVFGVPRLISELCLFAEKTVFVYLIDEVENFTEQQQRFLNSLVRYRKGNATLRIGARLYGIKTNATLGSGEPIKRDAEFESVELDALLREDLAQYEVLATKLVLKRLEAFHSTPSISVETLHLQFAELSSENYYQNVALDMVAARDATGTVRPHIARFYDSAFRIIGDKEIAQALVQHLEFRTHPLLEKVNLLAFYKRLTKGCDILALAKNIHSEATSLLENGPKAALGYHDLYSHFSSDLLAQLSRDYGRKPVYAGFKTLIRLSQGVPRNLLSLLKHIYRRSTFAGEDPFFRGPISVDAQAQGIQDASEWFWEDAQPDAHGTLVRNAVEHLATLLRSIRYSDNPSECDLCCFLVTPEELSEEGRRTLKMAENWSFIVHVSGNSGAKNDDRVLTKYQINPMLAARWGISESRRGTIELTKDFAELLLAEVDSSKTKNAISERIENMNLPKLLDNCINGGRDLRQTGLFDGL